MKPKFHQDRCCTLVPYFKIPKAKLPAFRSIARRCIAATRKEPKCLHYAFSFDGVQAHCREGYEDASGVLAHLDNVNGLLQEMLAFAELTRLEVHAPPAEMKKLRGPMAGLKPQFFTLESGIRR